MGGLEGLLDLLFPPKCPFCGKLVGKGEPVCLACRKDLPWLEGMSVRHPVELTAGCASALRYQDRVRKAVHDYKFNGRSARSRSFGPLIARAVEEQAWHIDLVSWPSLSPKRLRKRGYDQGELLAREVGKALALPVMRTLDKEERPAQSTVKGEAARRANLLGAYTAHHPEEFQGKVVLLVDDVLTTGATLSECAKTLLLAGAERVACATLARAEKGRQQAERGGKTSVFTSFPL